MSVTDKFTIFRPAIATTTPEHPTRLPAVLILIIALNAIASLCAMLSGIDLSAFVAM